MGLRRLLITVFLAVSMFAIAGTSVMTLVSTQRLLDDEVAAQLAAVRHDRSAAITRGVNRFLDQLTNLAGDPAVARAAVSFDEAMKELDQLGDQILSPEQQRALEVELERYVTQPELAAAMAPFGLSTPEADELLANTPAGRYLQHRFLVATTGEPEDRIAIDDPGGDNRWAQVHREYHPYLRTVAEANGFGDLLLIDAAGERVIYTSAKRPDLGGDLTGRDPAMQSLERIVSDHVLRVRPGDAVVSDFAPYFEAEGAPTIFVAVALRQGTQVVGTLIAEIPITGLSGLMSADRQWSLVGLGRTGETYLVGRDGRMRTDARRWLEDPSGYLDHVARRDSDLAAAVEAAGSTVLLQQIDAPAVRAALDGRSFRGRSRGPTGTETIADAAPLRLPGLDWVVVAEMEVDEATAPLRDARRRAAVLAALLLPMVAVLGWWLARRLHRPLVPLMDATERIRAGDLGVRLEDRSRDEIGHLARELETFAARLADEEEQLQERRRAISELMSAVLPERIADSVRRGELDVGDLLSDATVIVLTTAVDLEDRSDVSDAEQISSVISTVAAQDGLERVWSSADRHLYLAGVGAEQNVGATLAAQFISAVRMALHELPGLGPVRLSGAIASGTVAAGVVGGDHMVLGVWGRPVRIALALDAIAPRDTVLVDDETTQRLGDTWYRERADVEVEIGSDIVTGRPLVVPDPTSAEASGR